MRKRDRERIRARRAKRLLLTSAVVALVAAAAGAIVLTTPSGGLNTSLHQHPNIKIFINSNAVTIPPNIGIDPSLWNDHSMDEYQQMQTMSPLHTHESDGTLHLEMGKWHACTLGDFFDVWGQPFGRDKVMSYTGPVSLTVDGKPSEQYRDLVLQDGQQIVIRGG